MQFSPYLLFNGDCAEAFKFYEQTLGGKIDALMPFAGSPSAEHVPPEWNDKILHASMTIDGQMIMASDAPPGHYAKPQGISVSIALAVGVPMFRLTEHIERLQAAGLKTGKADGAFDNATRQAYFQAARSAWTLVPPD